MFSNYELYFIVLFNSKVLLNYNQTKQKFTKKYIISSLYRLHCYNSINNIYSVMEKEYLDLKISLK